MLPGTPSVFAAAFAIGSLMLASGNAVAAATPRVPVAAHPGYTTQSRHHRHYLSGRYRPIYDWAAPGYVFVPGRGIPGEACNMPTSTCTNEYRDIQ